MPENFFVGVDIGGTFTDVFISDGKDYWEGNWNPLIHSWNWVNTSWGTDFCQFNILRNFKRLL